MSPTVDSVQGVQGQTSTTTYNRIGNVKYRDFQQK